jgi:PAS domain S-box-containing protein
MAPDQALANVDFPPSGGEMAALVRAHDWASTSLGPIEVWPRSLKAVAGMMLLSPVPIVLLWGEDGVMLYNDAYSIFAGARHPRLLGSKVREGWPEVADFNDHVMKVGLAGGTLTFKNQELTLHRHGRPEQVWMNLDYSPVPGDDGRPAGVLAVVVETTEHVRAERMLRESEQRLRAFVTASSDAVYRMSPDWKELRQLDGRDVLPDTDEPIEGWMERYVPPDDRPSVRAAIEDAVCSRNLFELEHRVRRADGTLGWTLSRAVPMLGQDGEITEWLGTAQDVTARRAAEDALREQKELLQQLIDTLPVFIAFIDREGRYRLVNRTYEGWFGRPRNEILGKNVREVLGEEAYALRKEQIEAVLRGERQTFEAFTPKPDGTRRHTELEYLPRIGPDGQVIGFFALVADVTERRATERALAASERRMHAVLEAVSEALYALDVNWRFTLFNRAAEAYFGLKRDEVLGRTLWDVTPMIAGSPIEKCLRQAMETRAPAAYEGYSVHHPDRYIAMRFAPKQGGGVAASLTDITARRKAEEALQRLNETLEARVEERTRERNRVWAMSRDMLAVMGFDGRLKAISPAWTTTLGFDEATLLARDFRQQVHPDDHAAVEAVVARLRRGETITGFEDRLRHADGSWRWIAWSLVPEDEADLFYGVGRDVTAEKEASAALEQAQAALRQSQKMEAMGQLTGGVAHDFNNLLTPIVGSLDMLQRKGVGGAREQRLIEGALQAADRAKTLVQRLLAFARRQPLQSTAVDLAALARGMAEILTTTMGPQIKVVVNAPDDLPAAKADPHQLELAILNLAVNARDAMPDGGTLRITIDDQTVAAGHVAGLAPGRYVHLSVADTGTGMDEATLARAIEPFFSTKGIGKGTGLGLSMVHGLVTQLGGVLTLHSREGIGTNVEIWLPQTDEPTGTAAALAAPPVTKSLLGTVLLVDDEDLVRQNAASMLNEFGYDVVEASSAEQALEIIERGLRPILLITDHLMPGTTGTKLARQIQDIHPKTPVLIMSGYADVEAFAPDLPLLRKPFRSQELGACLAGLSASPR